MLHLHHSNKLEILTHSLLQAMKSHHHPVFEPLPILVQNPGMKRWLQQHISKIQGVAANLEFPLPSRFIWDIFQGQFQHIDIQSNYDSEVLRWRLLQILDAHHTDPELAILQPYLEKDDSGLARIQLSEKLASLFDQYLVYRPQMIKQWGQSNSWQSESEKWQLHLWQLLRDQDQQLNKAELIGNMIEKIQSNQINKQALPSIVYVFAISTLSPLYQNLISQLGDVMDVHFYILNPCQHYWGDVQSRKQKLRSPEKQVDLFEQDFNNDLLASMGQQGREFIDSFYDETFDVRDEQLFESYTENHLLAQVKNNVLEMVQHNDDHKYTNDGTIQVVSCYSELRELQVLHDFLLSKLQSDDTLQPHDIVIMSPDINTLSPYIDAVFGQQPKNRKISYSISDQNIFSESPLVQTVMEWLRLPASRFTVNQIMSYLELSSVQRKYDVTPQALETIRFWIRSNHIHWGLDGKHKHRLGLGEIELNSWKFGIQRLIAAYLTDDERIFHQHVTSECLPGQDDIQLLGNLHRFLDDLDRWSQLLQQPATVEQWQQRFQKMLDDLLLLDDDEEWQLKPLRDELAKWIEQSHRAAFNQTLDAGQVYHLLNQALALGSTSHHYLSGGINFCNLIPMRAIPFRIVCLLGLSNDRFPRSEVSPQFDLIDLHPKKGDRSRREDDRYMFLQSLMSAQDCFYISYVGRDQKDDAILEPSVLVTELMDHIEQSCDIRLDINETSLQVFSEKNFKLGSYADEWRFKDQQFKEKQAETFRFNKSIKNINEAKLPEEIELDELIKFYSNPAKHFMQQRLNISLQEYQHTLSDDELFELDALQQYQIKQDLMIDKALGKKLKPQQYLNSGVLPPMQLGEIQLQQQQDLSDSLFQAMKQHDGFSGLHQYNSNLSLQQHKIQATIESFSSKGLLYYNLSSIKGKHLFKFWIQHCFLCAHELIEFSQFYYFDKRIKSFAFNVLNKSQARAILQSLLDDFIIGQQQLIPFYVDTAVEYEQIKRDPKKGEAQALDTVNQNWFGENFYSNREVVDVFTQTSIKQSPLDTDELPKQFFTLIKRHIEPMLDHQVTIK